MTVPRFPCSKRLFSFVNPSSLPLVLLSFPFYPSFFPSSRRLFLSSRPSSPSSFLCVLPSYLCVPFSLRPSFLVTYQVNNVSRTVLIEGAQPYEAFQQALN